ncbi:MAG: ABC transporter ATP-binding protein [Rhodobiaceae bacterium]|nr:ABC transporter ATP-binding protein [Rhodobiaceae bacterium]|tara:strand:- start:17502 stop:19283 length:1782 start_codon:yes stop_codon:yes gene_type:complete
MKVLKKIFSLFDKKDLKNVYFLIFLTMIMALLETMSVIFIMPFIALASNPELITTNDILSNIYFSLNFTSTDNFLIATGILLVVLLIMSLAFRAIITFIQFRFIMMQEYVLGRKLINVYLNQPYEWFLSKSSADLGKNIISEVSLVVTGIIQQFFYLVGYSFTTFTLILLLLIVKPILTISAFLIILLVYGTIYLVVKNILDRTSKDRHEAIGFRFKAVKEAFGSIKDLKVNALEEAYLSKFNTPSLTYAKTMSFASSIQQLPRYALEAVAFGGIIAIMIFLIVDTGNFADSLPVVALFAFAGYRIMPALQGIYSSLTQLIVAKPQLDSIYSDLKNQILIEKLNLKSNFNFNDAILFENLSYKYPSSNSLAIECINLRIEKGSHVGFVGPTGSGKTTTVDIILGLLKKTSGHFSVDSNKMNSENIHKWQSDIGYVPQHIFLKDDSIASNIAFGIDENEWNLQKIKSAAKIANLDEFIINDLKDGYDTVVGDKGSRLSGGQKQRIGIARALYHSPKVLILDEATSALDNITEQKVVTAIKKMPKQVTVIMIAHRLSTIKDCDNIILFNKGKIVASGTYSKLIQESSLFKELSRE